MRHDLISLDLQLSIFFITLLILISLMLIGLLSISEIAIGYKFIALSIMIGSLIYAGFYHLWQPVTKMDILLLLDNAIIWQNGKSNLITIDKFKLLLFGTIVMHYRLNNRRKRIVIFWDSCKTESYKQLLRWIKWR